MTPGLTIVVPYFKKRFLEDALRSLAAQTEVEFTVILADDCSPEPAEDLFRSHFPDARHRYVRFPENLGRSSVIQHWNRAVRLGSTSWAWLFSDDDVLEPGCVAALAKATGNFTDSGAGEEVFRFDSRTIDAASTIVHDNIPHPDFETAREFSLARFKTPRHLFAQDHAFLRRAFDREGGFVDLPLAWFSDDASWTAFGATAGIRTIRGPKVLWRDSGINLSATNPALAAKKWDAFLKYLHWLETRFPDAAYRTELWPSAASWAHGVIEPCGGRIPLRAALRVWFTFARKTHSRKFSLLRRLV